MGWVKVAEVSDIPEGTVKRVLVKRHPIAVYHLSGKYYATDDVCTHDDASLAEGEIIEGGTKIVCPLHGAQFDIKTGDALTLPAVVAVEVYSVKVEGTAIMLEV